MLSKGTLARWVKIVRSFQSSLVEVCDGHGTGYTDRSPIRTDTRSYIFQLYDNKAALDHLSLLSLDNSKVCGPVDAGGHSAVI